ncbi:MAG: glycoside hydrolase family 44 protein [Bryobacteraceae bacterium]
MMRFRICLLTGVPLCAVSLYAQSAPTLAVDANASRHPISPYIYGINEYADSGLASMMHIPVRRFGGDATTSYNWQIDVSNSASDWYFINGSQTSGSAASLPDGSSFDLFHEANLQTGAVSLGTVSLMDWTPKDTTSCSFSVTKYGAQQQVDPYALDCGNGILTSNGAQIVNDPHDAYQPMAQTYPQDWLAYLGNRYGAGNAGGVTLWSMDNEPEWWYGVHIDIYQSAATYDDMLARNLRLAQAVKAADPSALVTGPVPSGWMGYFYSRADMASGWSTAPYLYWDNPTDQNAHGGVPWVEYYLQQMLQFEQQHGYRLLDVLDVHGYLAPGSLPATAGDAATETLRMTSTRALWDPNYIVPDTAFDDATGNQVAPQLIPRMHQWVNQNYPGTKLAITEYWWQALESITGAIAQADILGIFGQQALDYGTLWGPPAPTDPGAFAFKIFLNYDGNGSQFGSTGVSATTSDPDTLSIYAAQRVDSALTVLVLNKTAAAISDSISVANFTPAGTAQVWQYSQANLTAIVRQTADINVSGNSLTATFPAYSMTLLVIPQAQSAMTVPQPVVSAVTSAASYDASGVSPGEIVTIFGQSLGPAAFAGLQVNSSGILNGSIAGVQVFFNGYAAPMIYALATQLSAVVPYEVAGQTSVNVVVVYQGNASLPYPVAVAAAKTGIFTGDSSGHGQGAILNQDYSLNTAANPAPRGQYVFIYGTGEGLTTPPGVDGRISGTPLPKVNLSCVATIGGQTASVSYCGEAPGATAGLVQVNALVPESVTPGGAVPVIITIGGVASQTNVSMAVK